MNSNKKDNLQSDRELKDIIPNLYERKYSDEKTGETLYDNRKKNNIIYSEISPKTMRYNK